MCKNNTGDPKITRGSEDYSGIEDYSEIRRLLGDPKITRGSEDYSGIRRLLGDPKITRGSEDYSGIRRFPVLLSLHFPVGHSDIEKIMDFVKMNIIAPVHFVFKIHANIGNPPKLF